MNGLCGYSGQPSSAKPPVCGLLNCVHLTLKRGMLKSGAKDLSEITVMSYGWPTGRSSRDLNSGQN